MWTTSTSSSPGLDRMLLKQLHHHGGVRGLTKTTAVPRASFEDSSIDDGCSTLPEDAALIPNAVHGDLGEEKPNNHIAPTDISSSLSNQNQNQSQRLLIPSAPASLSPGKRRRQSSVTLSTASSNQHLRSPQKSPLLKLHDRYGNTRRPSSAATKFHDANGALLMSTQLINRSLLDGLEAIKKRTCEGLNSFSAAGGGQSPSFRSLPAMAMEEEEDVEKALPAGKKKKGPMPCNSRRPRLVAKGGDCLIRPINLHDHYFINLRNWFHLVIEQSWRNIIAIFAAGFVFSWLLFGVLYFLIALTFDDVENVSSMDATLTMIASSLEMERNSCIANVNGFTSAFLFSLETQHTIGYGTRYITEVCPVAFFVLAVQCVVGALLQTVLAGIVIAKVLRPKKRRQEIRFSKIAVVGPLDENDPRPALMIRLADIQHRLYLAESHVRLYLASTKINKQGDCELVGVRDMNVGYDTGTDRVLLLWPITVRHIIDEDSPFYELLLGYNNHSGRQQNNGEPPSHDGSQQHSFELVMTVEGIVEATGMTFQARTSFLPHEILWGERFTSLITLNRETGNFEVDYDRFESTEPHPFLMVDSPSNDCSSATATPTGLTPLSSHCSSRPQSPCPPPPLATAIEICNEEFDQQQEEMRGGVPDDDFENILLANRPETRILMQQAADDLQKASDAKILDYVQTEDGHIQQPTPNNNAIKASEFPRLKLSHFGASIKKKQKPVCRPRHLLLEGGGGNNRYGHGSGYDSDGVSPSSSIRRGNHSSNHNNPNKLFLDCGAFGSGRLHLRRHSMMDPSVVTSTGRRSERIEHDDDEGLRRHHYHNPINHHTSFYAPHPHMMAHSQHHQRLDKNRSSDAARTNNSETTPPVSSTGSREVWHQHLLVATTAHQYGGSHPHHPLHASPHSHHRHPLNHGGGGHHAHNHIAHPHHNQSGFT